MKTSRIKTQVPCLVKLKYEKVQAGEVFAHLGIAYIQGNNGIAVSLLSGNVVNINPGVDVTMLEAKLELTFRSSDA